MILNGKEFADRLRERGCVKKRRAGKQGWLNIGLLEGEDR